MLGWRRDDQHAKNGTKKSMLLRIDIQTMRVERLGGERKPPPQAAANFGSILMETHARGHHAANTDPQSSVLDDRLIQQSFSVITGCKRQLRGRSVAGARLVMAAGQIMRLNMLPGTFVLSRKETSLQNLFLACSKTSEARAVQCFILVN